jgi:rhamnogalacturonan endolyase
MYITRFSKITKSNLQMLMEVQSWPYNFPESDDFPKWDERGNVSGRLLVKERCVLLENIVS